MLVTKKQIFLWALYDFANSVVSIIFFLYFSQWLVVEVGVADIWFNLLFTGAAVLLLFVVPATGQMLDGKLSRIFGLRCTTIGTALFYGLTAVIAVFLPQLYMLASVSFLLGLFLYLYSFTFYTPLLNDLAREDYRGRISGIGISANYLGQIAGVLLAIPFANSSISFFGGSPRAETLFPAVIFFFILALPMLIWFREKPKSSTAVELNFGDALKRAWFEFKSLASFNKIGIFLVSYFLFNDAVLTASNNFPIFLERVFSVSDTVKSFILLGILVTSALGAYVFGAISDKWGHKKTLVFILIGWIVIFPLLSITTNFKLFVLFTTIMGFWFGGVWTVSRAVMSYLAPSGRINQSFGYFGLAERASSLIGPLAWGGIVTGFVSIGPVRYRLAVLVLTIFTAFGLWALKKVPSEKEVKKSF